MVAVRRLLVLVTIPLLTFCASGSGYQRPTPQALPMGVTFEGHWESTWGKMILQQEGKHVHGSFTGYREGGLSGDADGDVFRFVWDQRVPRQHGHGFMKLSPDGMHLEGRWGYLKDDLDGGRWAADRATEVY